MSHIVQITHPERVVFPRDGITKGEVVEYYRTIAPHMLPHLKNRRLTMQRFQPNIDAVAVFQKEMPGHFPDWVDRVTVPKHNGTVTHIVANKPETLVYLANQGCLTPHVGLQRIDKNEHPDQMIFDLDPSDENFETVRRAAWWMREMLDTLQLASFVKTTGSRGLHIVVPLDRKLPFEEVRAFARSVAESLARQHPTDVTTEQLKKNRKGRLFLDTNRNGTAQTAVPAFSVRALDGAPVAMPIHWEDLHDATLTARSFTIKNACARVSADPDPWQGMGKKAKSLSAAADRLAKQVRRVQG